SFLPPPLAGEDRGGGPPAPHFPSQAVKVFQPASATAALTGGGPIRVTQASVRCAFPVRSQANTMLCHSTRCTYVRVSLYGMFSIQMSDSIDVVGSQRAAAFGPAL